MKGRKALFKKYSPILEFVIVYCKALAACDFLQFNVAQGHHRLYEWWTVLVFDCFLIDQLISQQ